MTLVLRALLLSLLVIVCMGIGWFLVNGRRPARSAGGAVAKSGEGKRDRGDPKSDVPIKADPTDKAEVEDPKAVPDAKKEPTKRELTYEKDVMPIMQRACVSCHAGAKRKGGLDLRTFAALVKGGDNGAGVVPGKPEDSPLYDTVATGRMPPGARKLSPVERETIREWIASGAKGAR